MFSAIFLLACAAPPDVAEGRKLFNDPSIGKNGVACVTCHATVANEEKDGDGLLRPGFSLWGAAQRPFWRFDEKRSSFPTLADAVDVCVQIFQGGEPLVGKKRVALTQYLKSISPLPKQTPPKIETSLMADLNYNRAQYQNGDADAGRALFYAACHSCHPHGKSGIGPAINDKSVAELAAKIREGNGMLRGARNGCDWLPAFGANRLSDGQIADIAAYVVTLASR